MNCPKCGHNRVSQEARYCPECGASVAIAASVVVRQDVEQNPGHVIGIQTEVVRGDVYGRDVYQFQNQIYVLTDEARTASWGRFLDQNTPPYKFLSPYTVQDKALFRGRSAEAETVIRRIGEQRLLVIYGQAGIGKTSLLAASVIPDLIQYGALVIHVHEYNTRPAEAIYHMLAASADQVHIPLPDERTLSALVRAVFEATQGSLILVLDQFEQLFAPSTDGAQRAAFINELVQALQAVAPQYFRVIIALREEALGRLGELQNHLPDLLRSPVQLLPFDYQQAQSAIKEPLEALNYPVSYVGNLVTEQLIPDLDELTPEMPGRIQPPHLQIVCESLYQAARSHSPPHITVELYADREKGADGILINYLDKVLQTQLADEQTLAKQILTAMASPSAECWISPDQLSLNGAVLGRASDVMKRLVDAKLLIRRSAAERFEYAFASHYVMQATHRLASPDTRRRHQAQDELEHIWLSWLAREALATRGQLRYLAEAGTHLTVRSIQALLLLHSAVARDEFISRYLDWFRTEQSRSIIQQLEELQVSSRSLRNSRSTLSKAALLLGLRHEAMPNRSEGEGGMIGAVTWSAVNHPESITRRTAALALTALDQYSALDRLDWALQAGLQGSQRFWRKAELRGTLADADPEIEKLNTRLPPLDRARAWLWRARGRFIRDRHRILWLSVGGAMGAGLGLGLLRAGIAALANLQAGIFFLSNSYLGVILGAALGFGMALADPLLVGRRKKTAKVPSIWRAPLHPDRLPSMLAVGLGTLGFGMGHLILVMVSGLSLFRFPLIILMGFVAALGLCLALYNQPRSGWRLGILHWALRLGTAASIFVLTHWTFITAGDKGSGIAISWPGSYYRDYFMRYVTRWPELVALTERFPQWFEALALLDAALVGIVLTISMTAGLVLAARWLARWRTLVQRAEE